MSTKPIPVPDNVDILRPVESWAITTITGIEPTLIPDKQDPTFVKFRYPDIPAVRDALQAYALNQPIPIRDFERTMMRLRHLLYSWRAGGGK